MIDSCYPLTVEEDFIWMINQSRKEIVCLCDADVVCSAQQDKDFRKQCSKGQLILFQSAGVKSCLPYQWIDTVLFFGPDSPLARTAKKEGKAVLSVPEFVMWCKETMQSVSRNKDLLQVIEGYWVLAMDAGTIVLCDKAGTVSTTELILESWNDRLQWDLIALKTKDERHMAHVQLASDIHSCYDKAIVNWVKGEQPFSHKIRISDGKVWGLPEIGFFDVDVVEDRVSVIITLIRGTKTAKELRNAVQKNCAHFRWVARNVLENSTKFKRTGWLWSELKEKVAQIRQDDTLEFVYERSNVSEW